MSISGIAFAFTRGWTFAFTLLAIFPPLTISTMLLTKVMQEGFAANLRAYSQSAGYAEQALNAIRVVVAFGQERQEAKNYLGYLGRAKQAAIANAFKAGILMGVFYFSIFASHAYAYYIGSYWVEK